MQEAWKAFLVYRKTSLQERARFMRMIGTEMEALGDELLKTVMEETHLPEGRVKN